MIAKVRRRSISRRISSGLRSVDTAGPFAPRDYRPGVGMARARPRQRGAYRSREPGPLFCAPARPAAPIKRTRDEAESPSEPGRARKGARHGVPRGEEIHGQPRRRDPELVRVRQPRRPQEPALDARHRPPRRHRQDRHPARSTRASSTAPPARSRRTRPATIRSTTTSSRSTSGCNAYAAPLGFLEAGARQFAGRIPTILKLNNSDSLYSTKNPKPAVTGSVKDALRLGCAAVGFTIYPGSAERNDMYMELREIAEEAKAAGLAVVLWSYPRGAGSFEEGRDGDRRRRLRGADRGPARRPRHQGQAADRAHRAGRRTQGLRGRGHQRSRPSPIASPTSCRAPSTVGAS